VPNASQPFLSRFLIVIGFIASISHARHPVPIFPSVILDGLSDGIIGILVKGKTVREGNLPLFIWGQGMGGVCHDVIIGRSNRPIHDFSCY
jgi:hypothetical protein